MSSFVIGQKLWFMPSRHQGTPDWVTITKVGRKWIEADRGQLRFDIETLYADGNGYISPGRAWRSKDECDADAALNAAWFNFRRAMNEARSIPPGVTVGLINSAAAMLNLPKGDAS